MRADQGPSRPALDGRSRLDPGFKLAVIPFLPLVGWNGSAQHRHPEARGRQYAFNPAVDILFAGIGGVCLATAPEPKLFADIGGERSFLGLHFVRVQVSWPGNKEPVILLLWRIEGTRPDLLESVWMIRVEQEGVQQNTLQALVPRCSVIAFLSAFSRSAYALDSGSSMSQERTLSVYAGKFLAISLTPRKTVVRIRNLCCHDP